MQIFMKATVLSGLVMSMAACASSTTTATGRAYSEPTMPVQTASQEGLRTLPAAHEQLAIAVYDFEDQTGQSKPATGIQSPTLV